MVSIRRRRLIAASAVIVKRRKKRTLRPCTPETSSKSLLAKFSSPTGSGAGNGAHSRSRSTEFEIKKRTYQRKKHNTLCLRGVYFKNMKWQSAIKVGKKQVHLGTVSTKEDAAHLYDRAAYMCGRVPNFELSQTVKLELDALTWEEFLDLTRKEIANKKLRRRMEAQQTRHGQLQQQQQQQQDEEQEEASVCKFSVEHHSSKETASTDQSV
ncbi:ethylene-responsive transcription factor-like protein At4g13040 [Selaginella moellendorffii]|uniref:ethylene-responsive transcription factor-like protein At4g13040 n=1 Tax=Selaginella moellendorffii TaxID=88036 RepID=UPI000D1CB336|nr:ethylene-responsive transcription factor-like protein At4g13040 [Selaginella moellendorffii]|eukprot:XP_024519497.1 ethylene-responsive transcription factor-like protein At4g13040 [Selaginella moellendorffii]